MAKPQQQRQGNEPPKFLGQLQALGREMAKDVNSTMHEVFFGKQAGMNEPGTPLAPTQAMVTHDLTGTMSMDDLRGYAKERAAEAHERMNGQEHEQSRGGMEM